MKTYLLLVLWMIPFGLFYAFVLPHQDYVLLMTSVVGVASFIAWREGV